MEPALAEPLAAGRESFLSVLDVHRWLDEAFFSHQAALVTGDYEGARRALARYRGALVRHMLDEEETMLPIYERAGRIAGGGPELYVNEHRKLMAGLNELEEGLRGLEPGAEDLARRVIAVVDRGARFKNLMAHHDERERNILYPTLDRVATAEERETVLRECLDGPPRPWAGAA